MYAATDLTKITNNLLFSYSRGSPSNFSKGRFKLTLREQIHIVRAFLMWNKSVSVHQTPYNIIILHCRMLSLNVSSVIRKNWHAMGKDRGRIDLPLHLIIQWKLRSLP